MRTGACHDVPMRDGERAASQYDAMGIAYGTHDEEGPFNAYYERPATIALVGDVTGRRVLEAGCGPGALTSWLADHGAAVTAMDMSQEMVRLTAGLVGGRARVLLATWPTRSRSPPMTAWTSWWRPWSSITWPTGPRSSPSFTEY